MGSASGSFDRVYLIHDKEDLEILSSKCASSKARGESFCTISFEPLVSLKLTELGFNFVEAKSYSTDEIESHAYSWSRDAFDQFVSLSKNRYPDVYKIGEITLAEILRFDLEQAVRRSCIQASTLAKVLDKTSPSVVVYVAKKNIMSMVSEAVLRNYKISMERVQGPSDANQSLAARYRDLRFSIKNALGYSNATRYWNPTSGTSPPIAIFLLYGRSHLNQLLPVMQALKKSGKICPLAILVSDFTMIQVLKDNCIDYASFEEFLQKKTFAEMTSRIKALQRNWDDMEDDDEFCALFRNEGVDIWRPVEEYLDEIFDVLLPRWVKAFYTARDMMVATNARLVCVTFDAMPHEKSTVLAAKVLGVSTLVIQHGVTASHISFVPLTADKMAVYGEASKTFLVNHGISENRLVVTGRPLYDSWMGANNQFDMESTRARLNVPKGNRIVVLATGALIYHNVELFTEVKKMYSAVSKAMEGIPNTTLVIKVHPAEEIDWYKSMVRNDAVFIKDMDIQELVRASDLVLTDLSTVGLEAMMLGKPVITINLTGKTDIMPYATSGAAVGVYAESDLPGAITSSLDGKVEKANEISSFLDGYVGHRDGKSAKRVAELIEKLALN